MISYHHDEQGQAVVEFALIVPILLFLLMGMFLVGYWLNALQIVSAAARDGVRQVTLSGDCHDIAPAVARSMQVLDANPDHIKIKATTPMPALGEPMWVQVTYTIPIGFAFFEKTYARETENAPYPFTTVAGQATARMETDPKLDDC